jgi:isopenicillin N synthase-like dioxygenase
MASAHPIVDLSQISHWFSDANAVATLVKELRTKGWCLVKLTPDVTPNEEFTTSIKKFFTETPREEKLKKHAAPFSFAYSAVDHKEGFRYLTGYERQVKLKKYVPASWEQHLRSFSYEMDQALMSIMLAITEPLFGMSSVEMAKEADLPVAWGNQISMIDIVHYFNNNPNSPVVPPNVGHSVAEVNCVPHIDPGLISLSVLSTAEGLQLQDPDTKQWVDAPTELGLGVVWTGEAATKISKGAVRSGVHRVIYPKTHNKPRLTIWAEACTCRQIEPPSETTTPKEGVASITLSNASNVSIEVDQDMSKADFLFKVERVTGLPMSKVERLDDSFHDLGF